MNFASVILDIPTQALDTPYTYSVPDEMLAEVAVGCAVLVPFGRRQAVGFVVALIDDLSHPSSKLDPSKIKAIFRVLSKPYFDDAGAACALFLSERYIAPLSSCVRLFTPPGAVPRMVRDGRGVWRLKEPEIGPVDDRWLRLGPAAQDFTPRKGAVKQRAIIEALSEGELRLAELTMELGQVSSTLKTLEQKGVVQVEIRRRLRGAAPAAGAASKDVAPGIVSTSISSFGSGSTSGSIPGFTPSFGSGSTSDSTSASTPRFTPGSTPSFTPSAKPPLTSGQAEALRVIAQAQDRACGEVVMVDGVTGSGKTEIYLQAIERTLAAGRGAIVLVPEISLTPQTVARFRGRFGDTVAVMHSRMSQGERYDQWELLQSGAARVVVGARSALFTPLQNLGLIVIDEEHESSYKQDSAPRYVARDVARWMVRRSKATLVLGSATPSIEVLHACAKRPDWHQVLLTERVNGRPLPDVEVVDMAREFGSGHRSMFSRSLQRQLLDTMQRKEKAVLLLNQRGFASFVLCRSCGFVPECPSCSTSLTYHEKGQLLLCHHCGHRELLPPLCPKCESPYLRKFGAGTQRVEVELRELLKDTEAQVIRMDADTTSGKKGHQRLLESFAQPGAAVLLGTQMIAKGLDFDDVTLVGVINADTMLKLPDFRSAERTFSLIQQVAGRAGRADLPGHVVVQTYWADACAIRAAARYDRAEFLRDELPKRKLLSYPPYARMANVLVWGKDECEVEEAARALSGEVEQVLAAQGSAGWELLPANPCVLSKLRGTFRWHIVVKAPPEADVSAVLLPFLRNRRASKTVNVAVDVDPYSLL